MQVIDSEALRTAIRRELEREISKSEVADKRRSLLGRGLGWALLYGGGPGLAMLLQSSRPTAWWWSLMILWLVALPFVGWRTAAEYRAIMPRPAGGADPTTLEAMVQRSTLCPGCAAVVPRRAADCPKCGRLLRPWVMYALVALVLVLFGTFLITVVIW